VHSHLLHNLQASRLLIGPQENKTILVNTLHLVQGAEEQGMQRAAPLTQIAQLFIAQLKLGEEPVGYLHAILDLHLFTPQLGRLRNQLVCLQLDIL